MDDDPVKSLRDDFDIYKTQVLICGCCALVVIVVLIGALLYTIFSVRKLRKEFDSRIDNLEATRRFTISRPKVYSSSDPTSKLQGELNKALSVDSIDSRRRDHSPLPSVSDPNLGYLNQGYPSSPGLSSVYLGPTSPGSYSNINLRSPSLSVSPNSEGNINRIESFLNKTRQLYSQSSESTPRLPRTPNDGVNRDSNVFQFT